MACSGFHPVVRYRGGVTGSAGRTAWRLAATAVPGALAGALTAGLLFFLNPDLPFGWASETRASAIYGTLLGGVSAGLLYPLARRRRWSLMAAMAWSVALVLLTAAGLFLAHASRFAYYLPTGINQRLVKTGAWLAVTGLGAFYTALTHGLRQTGYSWRSRWGVLAMAVFAVAVVNERRASFRSAAPEAARGGAIEAPSGRRLLVIGLDAGTLDALLPLAEQGETPAFARLLQSGSYARLRTILPTWRIPVWTTLTTGKYPFKHGLLSPRSLALGVLGFDSNLRLLPQWMGFEWWGGFGRIEAVGDSRGRQARALFEMLTTAQLKVGVVSWPASSPLSPALAFGASDRFFSAGGGDMTEVFPPDSAGPFAERRLGPLDARPELSVLASAGAAPAVLSAGAADRWREAVAIEALGRQSGGVDSLWLQFRGLGTVSARLYGGYAAARQEGSREPDDLRAARTLAAYYGLIDRLVGEVLRRQSFDYVALVSAYGVAPESGWRRALSVVRGARSVGGSSEDGPDGVLVLAGPGVRAHNLISDADITDVVPTLLYALGLPVGDDLDGKVLTSAFTEEFLAGQALSFVPSYEGPQR